MAKTAFKGQCQIGSTESVNSLNLIISVAQPPSSVESNRFGGFTVQWVDEDTSLLLDIGSNGKWSAIIRTNTDSTNAESIARMDEVQSIIQNTLVSNRII